MRGRGGREGGGGDRGGGEGRGDMEQELLDGSYTEGRSDSEIELPDNEYDKETVTVEELVKTDEGNEQEQERISQLRREARNKQWENLAKNNQVKKAVKEAKVAVKGAKVTSQAGGSKEAPSKTKISDWKKELKALLPPCFEQQLDMLGLVTKNFPESSPITCEKPRLFGREGKSEFYRKLKIVQQFLETTPAKTELLLSWASDLAVNDYEKFKAHGLSFIVESDIPVSVLIWEKSERIKAEVWGNFRREDVRRLTLDHIIRVYQVSANHGVFLKVTVGLVVTVVTVVTNEW